MQAVRQSHGIQLASRDGPSSPTGSWLEEAQRPDEIVLRPKRTRQQKLTWAETYQQTAECDEDWSDWESLPEGLASLPGETGK